MTRDELLAAAREAALRAHCPAQPAHTLWRLPPMAGRSCTRGYHLYRRRHPGLLGP